MIVSLRTMDNLRPHLSSSRAGCAPAAECEAEPGSQAAAAGSLAPLPVSEASREQATSAPQYCFDILECLHCTSKSPAVPTFYIYMLRPLPCG